MHVPGSQRNSNNQGSVYHNGSPKEYYQGTDEQALLTDGLLTGCPYTIWASIAVD